MSASLTACLIVMSQILPHLIADSEAVSASRLFRLATDFGLR